jgi:hypothetical protein
MIMSRGLGTMQRLLLGLILDHGRPMTFDQLRAAVKADYTADQPDPDRRSALEYWVRRPVFERSMRRAIHSLLGWWLIALGDGGRAEPHRYFFHPTRIDMEGDQTLKAALQAALDADPDPGAKEAMRREGAKFMKGLARGLAELEQMSTDDAEGPKA